MQSGHSVTGEAHPVAYCGPALGPAQTLSHWTADPLFLGAMAIAGGAYFLSARRTLARDRDSAAIGLALAFLYISPFCAAGASLFLVRVLHHLALALLVAPLVARAAGAALARIPGGLTLWTVVAAAAMWAWHAPALYGWAAGNWGGYWLMQGSIVASATLFWDRLARANGPAGIAALLAAMVAMGALGAIITLAPQPLFAPHLETTGAWGLTALEDQQVAGLLMWAPASAVYLVAALAAVRRLATPRAAA